MATKIVTGTDKALRAKKTAPTSKTVDQKAPKPAATESTAQATAATPPAPPADRPSLESQDEASKLLGMAHALGRICCGATEELSGDSSQDISTIRAGMRHITTLVSEAGSLMAGRLEPVERAHAVCALVAADIGIDYAGRVGQHWSDEITNWALHAVCDVIERAKASVDVVNQPPSSEEVSHV